MPQKTSRRSYARYNRYGKSYRRRTRYRPYGYRRPYTNYKRVESALVTDRSLYASPYPALFETTNSYMGNINLQATAGAFYRWVCRANSVYDPDQTFTGTTAIGYASLALIYTNYYVKYCTIKIKAVNQTPGIAATVLLLPSVASNVYSTIAECKSVPYFKEVALDGVGSGGNIRTMMSSVHPHKLLNLAPKDANLIGAVGGSPANQVFWLICLQATDLTNTVGVTIEYEIFYRTVWFGRKPISQ